VGPPCSGKSTYIQELRNAGSFDSPENNTIIISRDDALMDIGKQKYPTLNYSELFKTLTEDDQKEVDTLVQKRFKAAIVNKDNIVIDMTNMNPKSRRKWLANVNSSYTKHIVVFFTGYEELMKRNTIRAAKTGKYIPNHIFVDMMKKFKLPMSDEADIIEFIL
jgi:predicted kinase